MFGRTLTTLAFSAVLACASLAGAAATSQPDADAPAATTAASPAQPTTDATIEPGSRSSQVSHLLTRSLPPRLRGKHLDLWARANPEQRQQWRRNFVSILDLNRQELEKFIDRKRQLDQMPDPVQDRYRQRAELIEQVLNSLSPAEQAELLRLTPAERARRINELAAELRARQTREPAKRP